MEIITKANPQSLDEIEKNFRPVEYRESDLSPVECAVLGLGVGLRGFQRVAIVYYVDRNDANKMGHLAKVLGPGTGGTKVCIPCGNEVEWAWIQECMEARVETLQRRAIARAQRLIELQGAINSQLPDIADNMEKTRRGHSTFGGGGFVQRVSS